MAHDIDIVLKIEKTKYLLISSSYDLNNSMLKDHLYNCRHNNNVNENLQN